MACVEALTAHSPPVLKRFRLEWEVARVAENRMVLRLALVRVLATRAASEKNALGASGLSFLEGLGLRDLVF